MMKLINIPMSILSTILQETFRELIDYIAGFSFSRVDRNCHSGKKRLLIIRIDAIGDFVLFLDSFKEYRKIYPANEWEITLLGNKIWSGLADCLPYADKYFFVDVDKFIKNMPYRLSFLQDMRSVFYDELIQPTFSRRYFLEDTLVRLGRAEKKIGTIGDKSNITSHKKKRSDRWYTELIHATEGIELELVRNAEFLQGAGLKKFRASAPELPLAFLPDSTLDKRSLKKPYFLISPGASWPPKRWDANGFSLLAKKIYKKTGWTPVLCAGSGDEVLAKEVISYTPELPWVNLAGQLSLTDFIWLIVSSNLVVSNDTAAVHIASSVKCPVVCIVGGGHFGRFFPYGDLELNKIVYNKMDCFNCNWQCIYSTVRCLEEISVEDAWQVVLLLLEKKNRLDNRKC